MVQVEISKDFGLVIFVCLTIATVCMIVGCVAGGTRKQTFGKQYMEENFGEKHRLALGPETKPNDEGYPDTGTGIYSMSLPYKKWYEFNLKQRGHLNFLETVVQAMVFTLVAGL